MQAADTATTLASKRDILLTTKIMSVVVNHASVARNAKVLRKEVARKDVRRGKRGHARRTGGIWA
jgi:hypothetical protein